MGSEHTYELAAAGGLISIVFLVFFWLFWTDPPRRARRALNRRPRPITALKSGQMATVEGKARHNDSADRSPGEPVYRQLQLEVFSRKVGSDGAVTERWETLADSVSAHPACIVENGSTLFIDLKSCLPAFEGELRPIDWSAPNSEARALAEEAQTLDTQSPARLRLREVLAEDTIRVAGKVTKDSHGTLHLVAPSSKIPLALGMASGS